MENITIGDFFKMYQLMVKQQTTQSDIAARLGTSQMTLSRAITGTTPIRPEWFPIVDQMLMEMDFDQYETVFRTLKNRRFALEQEQKKQQAAHQRRIYQNTLEYFLATVYKDKQYTACSVSADAALSRFSFQSDDGERLTFQYIDSAETWSFLLNDPCADRFFMFTENVDVMRNLMMHRNELTTATRHYPWISRHVLLIDTDTQTVLAEHTMFNK